MSKHNTILHSQRREDRFKNPRLTYVVSSQDTVQELQSANENKERHEGVEEHCALWRCGEVLLPDMIRDLDGGRVCF